MTTSGEREFARQQVEDANRRAGYGVPYGLNQIAKQLDEQAQLLKRIIQLLEAEARK